MVRRPRVAILLAGHRLRPYGRRGTEPHRVPVRDVRPCDGGELHRLLPPDRRGVDQDRGSLRLGARVRGGDVVVHRVPRGPQRRGLTTCISRCSPPFTTPTEGRPRHATWPWRPASLRMGTRSRSCCSTRPSLLRPCLRATPSSG